MAWTSLPIELQLKIARRLERDDLKSFRLSHRDRGLVATTVLFETIHISLNVLSFERAFRVAQSNNLAALVRRLVYHTGIIERNHTATAAYFGYPEHDSDPGDLVGVHSPSFPALEKNYQRYLEECDAQDAFLKLNEFDELCRLTAFFTNLESTTTIQNERRPSSQTHPIQRHFERRIGIKANVTYCSHSFVYLFLATADSALKVIRGDFLSWDDFGLSDTHIVGSRLFQLRELQLGFKMEFFNLRKQSHKSTLKAFEHILKQCNSLAKLDLELHELPHKQSLQKLIFQQCISSTLHNCDFPRLVHLRLRSFTVFENKFITFLGRQSSTLRTLELEDLVVGRLSPAEFETVPKWVKESLRADMLLQGSIISMFHKIHDTCQLKRASLAGNFTNRYDESWRACRTRYVETFSFLYRIERFLCRQGPSPFPPLAVFQRKQREYHAEWDGNYDLRIAQDDWQHAGARFKDHTWRWEPAMLSS